MPAFNQNDLTTYTVKQLRELNSREKLHIGSTSNMTKRDLIDNIKLTTYWLDKHKGGDDNEPEIVEEMNKEPSPELKPIELKPLVVEAPKVVVPEVVKQNGETQKVTTTVSKDTDGNTVIVIVIKPL